MDSFGRVIEIMLAAILLFLVPLNYMAMKQEHICQTYVTNEVSYFVDSVRNLGYITDQMYTVFIKKLEATNQVYEVELVHYNRVIEPILEGEQVARNESNYYVSNSDDILKELFSEHRKDEDTKEDYKNSYSFHQGDYFTVRVCNKNKTFATRLQEIFLRRHLPRKQILVVYGGAIRDENY